MQAGYFDDQSLMRRVHREMAVAFGGPRALLMMAAHPVAFEGFFMSTGALGDPYARLARTGQVMEAITWGPRRRADVLCRHVRAMHRRVAGVLPADAGPFPAGTPYRADDPELLLWILGCLFDSCRVAFERYVRPLDDAERDAYWDDYKVVAKLFGLHRKDLPRTHDDFLAYLDAMLASGELHVTPKARELGIDIVMRPPVPLTARPLLEVVNFTTVGLLPDVIRRGYGFSWDPVRGLASAAGAEYARRVVVPLLPERVRLTRSARGLPARGEDVAAAA